MALIAPELRISAFKAILRPFVRFCIRYAYPFQEFVRICKLVFVEVAEQELSKTTRKVNVSRLSVLTGLQRFEIDRIFSEKERLVEGGAGLTARVIGQWRHDGRFTTQSGAPKILTFQGKNNEFRELVESVSKSINSGTLIFELERTGVIEKTKRGVKLKEEYFSVNADPLAGLGLLSKDIDSLLFSVLENLFTHYETPHLHIRTEYDSISTQDLPQIRRWLVERGMAFHKEVREYLSQYDRDVNPLPPGSQQDGEMAQVSLTAFGMSEIIKSSK